MKTYYDSLFASKEGTQLYKEFIIKHAVGTSLLELACGTGDLLNQLNEQFDVKGVDLDDSMLALGYEKYPELSTKMVQGDFLTYNDEKTYDTLVCVGDSLNYILTEDDLLKFVDQSVTLSSHIILDCHHPYRLNEFADDYYEEGSTDSFDYAYQIEVDGSHLVHVINFLDGTFDSVYQWVFDPKILIDAYEKHGYSVSTYTDFNQAGISSEGEKVMFVITKERI
ncbi:class I SAM-dependent methyltransferase [Erysipelothrix rhusiopathiae]|uniref:class I SAM-dependent methyltransferase n=1 Tax=Erysipelothrix rhusiopathiae TaxID=1648 RepID=UPI000F438446|nr:class I SAM-dependent methyltransferase [Erysipelothrix rhusiopathiae]AYV34561.1 class I SAM-dependent methyltransferase [Erysipelothrix rhusiopathiae]MDE8081166.1 class I SAM-dependent methyltransferase [Erysipelothrix rhusiopathiae]MDE8268410.1 class I SAM-dependent methyltransferase [Erysipelothrix rhusiopathiae]MDE8329378.1 class I SAM-dependent methyltransferase [Erysipelothrix rhusiopathiae]MDE8333570.1 class I SAM-dependent methyltransferase [Erysipelothrix rhusiopathiae]